MIDVCILQVAPGISSLSATVRSSENPFKAVDLWTICRIVGIFPVPLWAGQLQGVTVLLVGHRTSEGFTSFYVGFKGRDDSGKRQC